MRYHALVINLCCDNFGYYSSFSNLEKRAPMHWSPKSGNSTVQAAVSSAREIPALSQLMRTEYGMEYGHQSTMYAVNVALYTLLEQPTFDILDSDFLRLTTPIRCPIMPNIRDLPNELLLWIVSHLDGSALFALASSCKDLDFRLQPSIWKYNVTFENSNLLHLAVKYDNAGLAEALLQHNANINAFY
ncbi:hypothetical protein E8E15_000477 [Penicillium rubens]|nr:hypothetical protein E8E15_000477 [Penicillium rubens]